VQWGLVALMLDDNQIEAIKGRAEEATPGPWRTEPFGNPGEFEIGYDAPARYGGPYVVRCGEPAEHDGIAAEDAEFIAHAREDIPALLADRQALIEQVDALVEGFEELERVVRAMLSHAWWDGVDERGDDITCCSCDTSPHCRIRSDALAALSPDTTEEGA
jgi:hypothetical protein